MHEVKSDHDAVGDRGRSGWARSFTWTWTVAFLLKFALPAVAQIPEAQAPQTPPAAAEPADPFGRDTPRGTITGLNLAVHREDFVSAARYLQTTARRPNTEELSRDLTYLIDRYFSEPITFVSDLPGGRPDDGLPLDRERIELTIDGKAVDIGLVRVKDPQADLVWLISAETLAQVPALRRSAGGTWLERMMPQALVDSTLFGISLARWVGWVASIVLPLIVLRLVSAVCFFIAQRSVTDPTRRRRLNSWYTELRWLVIVLLTLGIHLALMPVLGLSLRLRFDYSRIVLAVAVVTAALLLWRLFKLLMTHATVVAQRRGQAGVRSLLLLAERVSKALIVLATIFLLLTIAGVNTTTALAGVGLGGVAIALGAQKSVENLLGGVFLLADGALAVGDTCTISNRVGVVEDITLRSVRLRTIEQTLLSVPAGILSQSNVENFATRGKILVQSTLRLQYGATADQLRLVLNRIRTLLADRPDIETATSRIRLVDFGERAIELELFAYVLTRDYVTFLSVREELLLQIATIVESSGTNFAPMHASHQEPAADSNVKVHEPVG